jgi:RNA polymerase sigma-70 factor (ECF subfamily)
LTPKRSELPQIPLEDIRDGREEHLPCDDVTASDLGSKDGRAFEELFRQLAPGLTRYASRLVGSESIAQDIVMDVFLRLWRDRLELPPDTRLARYLNTSVRNASISQLRHDRVEDSVRAIGTATGWTPGMGAGPRPPDENLERRETKEIIRRAIEELPPRTRLVLELRWFHDMSYKEIARELGIQVKSVENALARALWHLRLRLQGERTID